jgi:hypothetical protein
MVKVCGPLETVPWDYGGEEHRARVDGRGTGHQRTAGPHQATATPRARCMCAVCYREGFSRIGPNSREPHVLPVSDKPRHSGRLAQPDGGAGTPAGRGCHLQGRSAPATTPSCAPLHEGRGPSLLSLTPTLTPLPLTSQSPQRSGEEGILQRSPRAAALAPVCVWSKPVNLRC